MLLDAKHLVESFDLGAISASSNSNTNVFNLGAGTDAFGTAITPDISNDGEIWATGICVDEDFASAGSPVVTIDLHTSAAEGMSSASTILTAVTDKTPDQGDIIFSKPISGTIKQYCCFNVATTAALTAGKMDFFFSLSPMMNRKMS